MNIDVHKSIVIQPYTALQKLLFESTSVKSPDGDTAAQAAEKRSLPTRMTWIESNLLHRWAALGAVRRETWGLPYRKALSGSWREERILELLPFLPWLLENKFSALPTHANEELIVESAHRKLRTDNHSAHLRHEHFILKSASRRLVKTLSPYERRKWYSRYRQSKAGCMKSTVWSPQTK